VLERFATSARSGIAKVRRKEEKLTKKGYAYILI
jgi:hypothetical protein